MIPSNCPISPMVIQTAHMGILLTREAPDQLEMLRIRWKQACFIEPGYWYCKRRWNYRLRR